MITWLSNWDGETIENMNYRWKASALPWHSKRSIKRLYEKNIKKQKQKKRPQWGTGERSEKEYKRVEDMRHSERREICCRGSGEDMKWQLKMSVEANCPYKFHNNTYSFILSGWNPGLVTNHGSFAIDFTRARTCCFWFHKQCLSHFKCRKMFKN